MMKKIYLLIVAMVLCLGANAQRFEYQLGLKGGAGFDWIRSIKEDYSSKDNGFCYKFGLTAIYNFGENYGLNTGFNVLGSKFAYTVKVVDDETFIEPEDKNDFRATYCQIPLLLKMRTDAFGSGLRFFGEIGYGFNILVEGQYSQNGIKKATPFRDVCSSFIVHLGLEKEVLNRSALQFIIGYDNFFSSMMTMKESKLSISNLCFELGFLF